MLQIHIIFVLATKNESIIQFLFFLQETSYLYKRPGITPLFKFFLQETSYLCKRPEMTPLFLFFFSFFLFFFYKKREQTPLYTVYTQQRVKKVYTCFLTATLWDWENWGQGFGGCAWTLGDDDENGDCKVKVKIEMRTDM